MLEVTIYIGDIKMNIYTITLQPPLEKQNPKCCWRLTAEHADADSALHPQRRIYL